MSGILDDLDSRAGSSTSLLRTVIGLTLRRVGGWMSAADFVRLMEPLDLPGPRTRTALARLKKKELLLAETVDGAAGYRLNPESVPMLERGDRRIFSARQMSMDDTWCLVSFSLSESERDIRHQLRRRLSWIGCGTVSPALWVCPGFLLDEVETILTELGIRDRATVFESAPPLPGIPLPEAVASWWDLEALSATHDSFAREMEPILPAESVSDEAAFAHYVRGVDAWRVIPYLDPGLPYEILPKDWPGERSLLLYETLRKRFAESAWQHVRAVTGASDQLG